MSEVELLEEIGTAAAADAPSDEVARIMKDAAVAVEKWRIVRAFNDYDRIQQVKIAFANTERADRL